MSCLGSTDQESAMKNLIAALTLVIISPCVWAASQTVTLSVPGMTCPACPFTVKKALTQVPGVHALQVRYQAREQVVTFHDIQTQDDALPTATSTAAHPSPHQTQNHKSNKK